MLEALTEPRRALALAGAYRPLAERALADEPLDTATTPSASCARPTTSCRRCCGPRTPSAASTSGAA